MRMGMIRAKDDGRPCGGSHFPPAPHDCGLKTKKPLFVSLLTFQFNQLFLNLVEILLHSTEMLPWSSLWSWFISSFLQCICTVQLGPVHPGENRGIRRTGEVMIGVCVCLCVVCCCIRWWIFRGDWLQTRRIMQWHFSLVVLLLLCYNYFVNS